MFYQDNLIFFKNWQPHWRRQLKILKIPLIKTWRCLASLINKYIWMKYNFSLIKMSKTQNRRKFHSELGHIKMVFLKQYWKVCKLVYIFWRTVCQFVSKVWNFGILFDSEVSALEILSLEMYWKEMIIDKGKNLTIRTFTVSTTEVVKSWEQC